MNKELNVLAIISIVMTCFSLGLVVGNDYELPKKEVVYTLKVNDSIYDFEGLDGFHYHNYYHKHD